MIVYAVNVHTGGGKVLLDELLINEPFGKVTALLHDSRYVVPASIKNKSLAKQSIQPSITQRLLAEFKLKKILKDQPQELVLFFGNLPPFWVETARSALYLQNSFLLPGIKIETNHIKTHIRLLLEKLILRLKIGSVSEIWVQSDWMARAASKSFSIPVFKRDFLPRLPNPVAQPKIYDLIAVTSFSKHKNLNTLLGALKIIDQKIPASLTALLVLDEDFEVSSFPIPDYKQIKLLVRSRVGREELYELYQKSRVSVITSSVESYCIPLFESLHFGLKIVSLKRPYSDINSELIYYYDDNSDEALADALLDAPK